MKLRGFKNGENHDDENFQQGKSDFDWFGELLCRSHQILNIPEFSISQKVRRHHIARHYTKPKQQLCKYCIGLLIFLLPHILDTRAISTFKAMMLSPAPPPVLFTLPVLVLKLLLGGNNKHKSLYSC